MPIFKTSATAVTAKDIADTMEINSEQEQSEQVIEQNNLHDHIIILGQRLTTFADTVRQLPPDQLATFADRIFAAAEDATNVACVIYTENAKSIGRGDLKSAFSSYLETCDAFVQLLVEIEKLLPTMFQSGELSLYEVKVSQLSLMGIVAQAQILADYVVYLLEMTVVETTAKDDVGPMYIKPYKIEYLKARQEQVVNICANLLEPKAIISNYRSYSATQQDIKLLNNSHVSNLGFYKASALGSPINLGMRGIFFMGNPFRWLGEQWNVIRHMTYVKRTKERESIQAHVNMLQMDLEGMNHDSDEYRRQVKIIKAYNEMISDLDRKIKNYEEH